MKLKELFSKPINRQVNPAVSATKFDEETKRIEIEEYVFTDEIINGLYRILSAIKDNKPYDHVGIWIDGYYGSGKSHFLKYLDYCITPATREKALSRLLEAVKAIDPLDVKYNIDFEYNELQSIAEWLKKATIDTCIFNLETSYDNSTDKRKAFLHVFWNEFNHKRGFNKFNISLAQNLEKPLAEKGVFEEFKRRIAEEGGDWDNPGEAADMIDQVLDMVLDIAKELAPTLSIDSIRERILKRDTIMSIDRFGMELATYIKDKGENYRLIFLADEVSQFINKERDRYLNLQEIITKLSEACENKVWVACTAQQDLSEILDDCKILEEKDKEGKIKGRFEVKVSLKGTQPEVITQKRILDKREEVKDSLSDMYRKYKSGFDLQFKLPNSYKNYDTEEDFIDYYPFVPYQFKLIMQVFNSFLNLGYVAKEVKGNERSIIKVIHSTAKANAEAEMGKFISFDELYNNMFEEGLQARGQKAVDNAVRMARTYHPDRPEKNRLAIRVANILFMICNISQTDQLLFPANVDNITSLLVNDMETPRLTIKNEVEKIVDFLCENNIIRREQGKKGLADTFTFYSEEEMKVAQLIKIQQVDNNTQAEKLKEIFNKYITAIQNKEVYKTRSFSIGLTIKQRSFLNSKPEVMVEFYMDADYETAGHLALQNFSANRMVYYLGPQYNENNKLKNAFHSYCQTERYMATPVTSEENRKIREKFSRMAKEQYDGLIRTEFEKILDSCPIIIGQTVIDPNDLLNKRGNERYRAALQKHFANFYTKAGMFENTDAPMTSEQLKRKILRPIDPADYEGMKASLTNPEHEIEIYLLKEFQEVNVADIVAKFQKPPYGWNEICILYAVNELVRRHKREYAYANNPNVDVSLVANRILSETNKFTVRQAAVISSGVIQEFIQAWKEIFGLSAAPTSFDSSQLFRECRDQNSDICLMKIINSYKEIEREINAYPFCRPIQEARDLFESWMEERDHLRFFQAVIGAKDKAKELIDQCKEVTQFTHDQLGKYRMILKFVTDNKDNFDSLPEEMRPASDELKRIVDDTWPITKFRGYLKLPRQTEGALNDLRDRLRKELRNVYEEQFNNLEKMAKGQDVPLSVLPDRESTIQSLTSTENIIALQGYLSSNKFYDDQVERILSYVKPEVKTGTESTEDEKKNTLPPEKPKHIRKVSLKTKTVDPMTSEADIDRYLDGLRRQLLELLAGQDGIIVTK